MQITADFGDLCRVVCPSCARGVEVRYRSDSGEYVHDERRGKTFSHSICWANGLWKKYTQGQDHG